MEKLKAYEKSLTVKELGALRFCFEQAEQMMGAYVGHPDPGVLKAYRKKLETAQHALNKVAFQVEL